MHYGVLGMKWGVRRARKSLSNATTSEQRDKAISSLNKHRTKSVNKIGKLDKRISKLEKRVEKNDRVGRVKAAQMSRQAARLRKKTNSFIRITLLDDVRNRKAARLDSRSENMKLRIEKTKSNLMKNQRTRQMFEKGIQDIDSAILEAGKRIVNA